MSDHEGQKETREMLNYEGRKILTHREAAAELGVSTQMIGRWMDAGELPYIWLGGYRRLTREIWDHFLNERTMTGPLVDGYED